MAQSISTTKPHLAIISLITAGLLLIPLAAMQFTDEVQWRPLDFFVIGLLIFATGISIDIAVRKAGKYRALLITGIVFVFLLIWAELAVGIFTRIGS